MRTGEPSGIAALFTFAACVSAFVAQQASSADAGTKIKVKPVVQMQAEPFQLADVKLLDGPFKHAMELDQQYLLSLDVDRLLHNFRVNAGLPSTALALGGWEEPTGELRGHFVGHYLSACALMYASTGDPRFKAKGNAVVAGLAECQAKIGTGYLSAFPESFIDRVEKRERVWAPYYTMHKIFAGLEDMYRYCDNQQALEVCRKFADWVIERNSKLSDEQMQAMLGTEHGGMNETLANLYAITGEDKYLKISLRFNHHRVIDPASHDEDTLTGLHANTQIPKFIGTARQFELTADPKLKEASTFFWNTVVKERSYVIGGHSDGEGFSPKERLSQALGPNTTETCNTYNMLKLTRHLFCWDPQAEYADYYERALYNHILASQNPETGMMCYYVPLRAGSKRNFNTPTDSFWCCTGTGVENHAKYGDSIYFHHGNELFVNLFIASELNWKDQHLKIRQETRFPDEPSTKLTIVEGGPVVAVLRVRHPYWALKDFEVKVNGQAQPPSSPESFPSVLRTWKKGDVVEVSMPFSIRIEAFKDNPDRFALMDGPLVLAAEVDTHKPLPVVVAERPALIASLKPVVSRPNTFSAPADIFRIAGDSSGTGLTFEPFYKLFDRHYETYWDKFTPTRWASKEKDYEQEMARQKEVEARTVDFVNAGEEQNERDHYLKGEFTETREFGDRSYRFAMTNGWFSWELKVLPDQPQELSLMLGGGGRGGASVDIFVDGKKLASEKFEGFAGGGRAAARAPKTYPLSAEMLRGKNRITVSFRAPAGMRGMSVASARILKSSPQTKAE